MDTLSRDKRAWVMSRVRSKGNKSTELKLMQLFRRERLTGWRRGLPLYGRPDFVFQKKKIAVFVDGCFWHGHPTLCRIPATNRDYWTRKIARNKERDQATNARLRDRGWNVVRIWEHEIDKEKTLRLLRRLLVSVA